MLPPNWHLDVPSTVKSADDHQSFFFGSDCPARALAGACVWVPTNRRANVKGNPHQSGQVWFPESSGGGPEGALTRGKALEMAPVFPRPPPKSASPWRGRQRPQRLLHRRRHHRVRDTDLSRAHGVALRQAEAFLYQLDSFFFLLPIIIGFTFFGPVGPLQRQTHTNHAGIRRPIFRATRCSEISITGGIFLEDGPNSFVAASVLDESFFGESELIRSCNHCKAV